MGVLEVLGSVLLAMGCLLALTGSVGVLRMPDFYSRLHPAGKTDTLGQLLMLCGLMLFAGQQMLTLLLTEGSPDDSGQLLGWANIVLKVLLLSALLFVTAPTSTHAIAKAARLDRYTQIPVEGDRPVLAHLDESARLHPTAIADDITRRLDPIDLPPAMPEQEEPR
jgi:multicomponent Na+:H+ antiporter subunit G